MNLLGEAIFYTITFLSVYVQVFFLVTFLENRKEIFSLSDREDKLDNFPAITIIVPCWNEESNIYKTVRSILDLNYPKNRIQIFLVDDGSTDGTWNIIRRFAKRKNLRVFKQENGGKHTALNLGLANVETEFLACMDADSVAHPDSLIRIMKSFEQNPRVMAVMPSIVVKDPKNIIEKAQRAEYYLGVFIKKMLGFLGAIYVTPGPLTVFRKKVFDNLGPYRQAHNTEDMEIACRMQKNHYQIEHCHNAYVYTNIPSHIYDLYRQRLRWLYGFINNTLDYKDVLFRSKYGNFSLFSLPAGIVAIFSISYFLGKTLYNFGDFLITRAGEFSIVGFNFSNWLTNFDFFFFNFNLVFFATLFVGVVVILSIIFGRKMSLGKWVSPVDIILFFSVFGVLAPFWFVKAVYNTILSRPPIWR